MSSFSSEYLSFAFKCKVYSDDLVPMIQLPVQLRAPHRPLQNYDSVGSFMHLCASLPVSFFLRVVELCDKPLGFRQRNQTM